MRWLLETAAKKSRKNHEEVTGPGGGKLVEFSFKTHHTPKLESKLKSFKTENTSYGSPLRQAKQRGSGVYVVSTCLDIPNGRLNGCVSVCHSVDISGDFEKISEMIKRNFHIELILDFGEKRIT
jgi:hypothetical protein